MTWLVNRALILAKVESTYGTDATPVPGTDAVLTSVPELTLLSHKAERDNVKSAMGALVQEIVGEGLQISFSTEVKGDGSAVDTPPELGVLLRGCNFTETVNAATDVTYDPNSDIDTAESLSIYFHRDGRQHKILGARGTWTLECIAREYAKINWEFRGLYAGPTDVAFPAGTFNATQPPAFKSASFQFDSYSAEFENLMIAANNEIALRPDANQATGVKEYFVKDRRISGEFDPIVPTIATYNFENKFTTSARVALTVQIGTASMNRVTITAPKVQIDDLAYGDRENLLIHSIPIVLTPDSGDDEVQFVFD